MPRRNEIESTKGFELYSIEIYAPTFFDDLNADSEFEKWAAVEVFDDRFVPDGMETIVIPEGLYIVFNHKGPGSTGAITYNYIFREWLPSSEFVLDSRPHFAMMGEKYKHEDPASEEEIWIPVRPRGNTRPR